MMPGPPAGNTNRLRDGSRTDRHGMVLAELGRRYPAIYRDIRHLRRLLEREKAGPDGTIPVMTTARINQACRWEMTARVAQRMVATEKLTPKDTLTALNTMTHATRQRDALLHKLLANGTSGADPWAALEGRQTAGSEPGTDTIPVESTARGDVQDDQEGNSDG